MGSCRKGEYTTNEVVTHGALLCWGGFGQPVCRHLAICAGENGISGFRVKDAKRNNAPRSRRKESIKGNPKREVHGDGHALKSLGL